MADFIKSKIFWATFIVVAAVVFLIGNSNAGKFFVGETNVLVLTKSDATARNINQIISNVTEIPQSLAFYDKLLEKYDDIEDLAPGLSDNQRKTVWNAALDVEQVKNSGVVSVRVTSPNQLQAEIISGYVARDVALVMSRYYDIRNELDIRVIDGPIVSPAGKAFSWGLLILSLGFGILAGIIVGIGVQLMSIKRKSFFPPRPGMGFPPFTAPQAPAGTETKAKTKADKAAFADQLVQKEMASSGARKAGAPDNLPVGSEFVLSAVRRAEKAAKKSEEASLAEPKTHEATEEEIKQRLNKLLGGKL